MSAPAIFRRDARGRFVSIREAVNAWELSLRMAPARDAEHQLRRALHQVLRVTGGGGSNPDRPSGFEAISVFGKRVPEAITADEALRLLEARH